MKLFAALVFLSSPGLLLGQIIGGGGVAQRVITGSGAPASSSCNVAASVGKVYINKSAASVFHSFYTCDNTGTNTYAWELYGGTGITAGGTNGIVYQNSSGGFQATATGGAGTLCLVSVSGGTPVFSSCSGSASTSWSALTNPTGNMGINVGTFTSLITVQGNTSTSNMFSIIDATGNTGTGSLFEVNTVGTSTAHPFTFTAQGTSNGIQMSTSGAVAAIGTGSIAANTVPIGGIAGLGTGVGTALAINVGSAGAFVTFGGALGTPSSGNASNLTNLPITLTTTGSSGAATWTQSTNTLNIPQYSGGGGSGSSAILHTVTFSSTPAFTCSSSSAGTVDVFELSTALSANISPTISGCTAGETVVFSLIQNSSGPTTFYQVTWPSGWTKAGQPSPVGSVTTVISGIWDGTNFQPFPAQADGGPSIYGTSTFQTGTPASGKIWCQGDSTILTYRCENASSQFFGMSLELTSGQLRVAGGADAVDTGLTLGSGVSTLLGTFSGANLFSALVPASGTCSSSTYLRGDGACITPSGGGNVSNSGTPAQYQVGVWVTSTTIAGIAVPANGTMFQGNSGANPSWTATPTLGASGTLGSLAFGNATSGTVTLQTVTGALGSVTASLPANTGTIAELNLAQTFSALQTYSAGINLSGSTSPLQFAGSAGTAGQCAISGGASTTPNWGSCGGGGGGLTINSTSISGSTTNAILYSDGTLLQNATGITRTGAGALTHTQTALGTTPNDAIELVNTTAAATGAQQISPSMHWQGQGFASAIAVPGAATAGTPTTGGSCTAGTHQAIITFITAAGETTKGAATATFTCVTSTGTLVPLTAIPTGPNGVTGRNVYMSKTGTTTPLDLACASAPCIADNVTTTFNLTLADGSLGAASPATNTASLSENEDWISYVLPVQGTTAPTGQLIFAGSFNGAAYVTSGYFGPGGAGVGVGVGSPSNGNGLDVTSSASILLFDAGGVQSGALSNTGQWSTKNTGLYCFSNNGAVAGCDTAIERDAAGIISIIQGTQGTTAANYRDLKLRHFGPAGTAPTVAAGGAISTSPTISGFDIQGTVSVPSTAVTTGTIATVTFGTAHTVSTSCMVTQNGGLVGIGVGHTDSLGSFTITAAVANVSAAAYLFDYSCTGT